MNLSIKFLISLFLVSCFLFLAAGPIFAAEGYKLEVPLPPLPGTNPESGIAGYIQYLYVFAIALAGFLALGMMVYGGLQYVLAAGNVAKVEDAKDIITQALWGLGLVLVSYLLLRTINPDLVKLRNPSLVPVQINAPKASAPAPGVIAPGQISTGQQCQKDADCTAGGILGGRLVCQSGRCEEFITGGF